MSILFSPLWPELEPYFQIVQAARGDSAKQRVRIELRAMPEELYRTALQLVMPCVDCGKPNHPIRARRAPAKRGLTGSVYYAAACPLSQSVGCSRGATASAEYLRVRAYFEAKGVAPTISKRATLAEENAALRAELARLKRVWVPLPGGQADLLLEAKPFEVGAR